MFITILQGQIRSPLRGEHPVKTTAISYLKEVLAQEKYEDCQDIIAIAREFGAPDTEIKEILEHAPIYQTLNKRNPVNRSEDSDDPDDQIKIRRFA